MIDYSLFVVLRHGAENYTVLDNNELPLVEIGKDSVHTPIDSARLQLAESIFTLDPFFVVSNIHQTEVYTDTNVHVVDYLKFLYIPTYMQKNYVIKPIKEILDDKYYYKLYKHCRGK